MLSAKSTTKLTSNQVRGFWAAWGGWALDGMDSFIYALVLQPALRELLPRSGLPSDVGTVGYYNGLLLALFLVGWGLSMLWGPVGDRFGRVRTLIFTILCYSVFTFAGALAANIWQLAIFRLLAGVGIGGEWTLGGTFVAEEWPESRRKMGAGYMQTGYYFGVLIAALLNATVGAAYGWRAMFAIGGLPAFLVVLIQFGVHEPARWKPPESARRAMAMLFSPRVPAQDASQLPLSFCFDQRIMGRVGIRALRGRISGRETRLGRDRDHASRLLRDHAPHYSHDFRMPRAASAGGAIRPALDPGRVFLPDVRLHRAGLRLCVLLAKPRAGMVPGESDRSRFRRRELHHVLAVAAGAIPHRMPRQRLWLRYLRGTIPRGRQLRFWKAGW